MTSTTTLTRDLEPLTSSGLELADPAADLRGREVRDRIGEEIGIVADLMVDPAIREPRMLLLESGGVLGLGKKRRLVPLEVIVEKDPRTVHLDRLRDEVFEAPEYREPSDDEEEEAHYMAVYASYRVRPYWEADPAPERIVRG